MTTGEMKYGAVLRGGRMTKHKGQVASFAPMMGWALSCASTLALGAAASLGGSAAQAGSCTEQLASTFVCSGPAIQAGPAQDRTQTLTAADMLTVFTNPGFGLIVDSSDGLNLSGESVEFTDANDSTILTRNGTAIGAQGQTGVLIRTNGTVGGTTNGIYAQTQTGDVVISSTNDTYGSVMGISARNVGGNAITVITTGSVTGGTTGIDAANSGSGALTIDVEDVTGTTTYGILATNYGTDLSITSTGNVTGQRTGIRALNNGSGALTIDAATVGGGISARTGSNSTDLSITASGAITSINDGINAYNGGSGDLTVNVGDITSDRGGGISANSGGESGAFSITSSGTINALNNGISTANRGSGTLTIYTAAVYSANSVGINALNFGSGTDLSVTVTDMVQSRQNAIAADNRGSGALTIQAATVTSRNLTGIYAENSSYSTDLSIDASGPVTGNFRGIDAFSEGSGTVTLNVADVSGGGDQGIRAIGGAAGMSITSSGLVRGQSDGIYASNRFGEALTIDVVDVQGATGAGINARSGAEVVSITTTGSVVGATYGIKTETSVAGTQQIAVSGEVSTTGGNLGEVPFAGVAIQIDTFGQIGQTVIDLQEGAQIQSERTDFAIREEGGGDTSLILRDGAALAGSVELGSGDDSVTIEGGADISLVSRIDGGFLDKDELIFSGFTGAFEAEKFDSFESLTAQDGGNLTVNSADLDGFTSIRVDSGAAITAQNTGFSFANDVSIGASGRFLDASLEQNTISLGGSVLNDGLISLADGGIGDSLTVGGDLSGSGTIGLDVNLATGTHDQVQVNGDTAGATQGLDVDAAGSTVDTAQTFTLVTVAGDSTESDFQLVDADFVTNDGAQAISDGDLAYRLVYDATAGTYVLTPFSTDPGTGDGGDVTENPGGAFFAAGVQQANDQLTFGSTLQRVMGATQRGASDVNTVSRALNELTSTTRPLVWVQGEGRRDSYTVDDRDVETNSGGLRFGAALPLTELSNGTLIGGLEFGISSLSTDVTTSLTGADISTDAYDVTLSALWVADSLLYVDGQMRYGDFDSTTRPNGGQSVDTDSDGYGLSIEVGKPFALANGLTLVPQAQLMYSDIDADNVVDLAGGGQTGSLEDGDTLTARLGLRAEHTLTGNAVLFGQVDYYHAFDNETAVAFGQNTVLTERGKNTAGLTLGGNVALSERTTLFGELTGETGFGSNASDYAFGGNIGFEFRF
ncbi:MULTISPECIES: autotransporter outer membrane beta-barrel domain-containing protein [unclassified Ruegeria]|uniref:autotransporter outer membrane beta-barrel domain-containing protein n=1 Tax=unclassified Ruegeria TaxID=2625375 RepID=UPI001ADA3150|nr:MULTISPECIES: autotransporter outer membrane beta-barrel domain-containing protein [unclassified Ruegeria]MBO9410787.1 autotransporter outer membrane beta-barrel domain-containing protein [Ruegeria sp. R8_1]MBO9414988.1 autotransporter outer membrane beta-barrel domain-containing protein [Ruegeria sp. R8_2]